MDNLDELLNTIPEQDVNEIVEAVLPQLDIKSELIEKFDRARKVTVNDIVPEELQQRLMQIDITLTQCYWMVGDIVVEIVNSVNRSRVNELGKIVTMDDIYEAVGFFCHRSARSVRYYYEVASYFPQELRDRYELPFNVFAEARYVRDWKLMLEIAHDNQTWSLEHVREEYYRLKSEPVVEHVSDSAEEEVHEQERQKNEQRYKDILLSQLDHVVDRLRSFLLKVEVPNDIGDRITGVLDEIKDIEESVRGIM